MNSKRFIQIKRGKIFLSLEHYYEVGFTTFPNDISFSSSTNRLLEVEADFQDGHLTFEISDYNAKNWDEFSNQELREGRIILSISFKNLDYTKFVDLLSMYSKPSLAPFCDPATLQSAASNSTVSGVGTFSSNVDRSSYQQAFDPFIEQRDFSFKSKWDQVVFQSGKFEFNYVIPNSHGLSISGAIHNPSLRKELSHIAPFFSKKFGSKYFEVHGVAEFVNRSFVKLISLESPQLSMVTQELIAEFKRKEIDALRRAEFPQSDGRSLRTINELLEQSSNSEHVEFFEITADNVVELFATKTDVRNGNQLRMLAGHGLTSRQEILFTTKPRFGFLFKLITDNHYHFWWELLDSNATYVWTLRKDKWDAKSAQDRVDECISVVMEIGRSNYRRSRKQTGFDSDVAFIPIDHDQSDFAKWRMALEVILAH